MPVDLEELRRCAALLEACVEDRGALAEIPEEDRKRFCEQPPYDIRVEARTNR